MRVLYAASPAIAVPALEALLGTEGIELAGVLTNPDTPRGRHGALQPTDAGEAAKKHSIFILKPEKLNTLAREQAASLNCDLLISFAYGQIFGPKFLALFPLGGINIHPSLLPKYRGPTPLQAAILNRDTVTGITIQKLALEMDCGDILMQEQFELTGKETSDSLSEIAGIKAAQMLPELLKKRGGFSGREQNHSEATYCSLITKEDGVINWNCSAPEIEAKIRAFTPWPLCRTIHNGRELIILKADVFNEPEMVKSPGEVLGTDKNHGILIQTGKGILAATHLQYQAKKALFWRDFLNGARDFTGSQLGF
ncbi:MAG: methionyl-tRNA formyltransferase [Treponema sp.]|nr:methionyl-tRNA formyltransferase [Treponema sp.]